MRNIAGLLLIVAFVMHVLLGGGALISSKYEEIKARTEAGDLSAVAGDLVDEDALAKERAKAKAKTDTSGATRKRVIGVALLVLAAGQFLSAILLFLGRRRAIALGVIGLSVVATAAVLLIDRVSTFGVIGLATLVLALALALLSRRSAAA